jgi:hypothetical protein
MLPAGHAPSSFVQSMVPPQPLPMTPQRAPALLQLGIFAGQF